MLFSPEKVEEEGGGGGRGKKREICSYLSAVDGSSHRGWLGRLRGPSHTLSHLEHHGLSCPGGPR